MRKCYTMVTRLLLLWFLLISTALASEQGLLWHISGKGVDSYLFGTMHSDDPRVARIPSQVERHFTKADTLMLEVSLDAQTEMAVALQMMLPSDTSLSSLLGDALGRQAQQAMLTRGIPPEVTERFQPWAVTLTLSMPEQKSGQFLDKLLYQRALQSGKAFQPLESADEQIAVFARLSIDEQKDMLRQTLKDYQDYPRLFEQMIEAYLNRDLARLEQISNDHAMSENRALQDKVMARLLEQRNHRMVERMEPHLQQGIVFVAIGALHLPGDEGLIALLRQRGYRLSRIY